MKTRNGFSLPELLIGVAIGGFVLVGVAGAIVTASKVQSKSDLQTLVDNTYFNNIRFIRSSALVGDNTSRSYLMKLVETADANLQACFGGSGSNCAQYATSSHDFSPTEGMNTGLSPNGLCVPGPGTYCPVRSSVTYRWDCDPTTNRCSGLRVSNTVEALDKDGNSLPGVRRQSGVFSIASRGLTSKTQLRFQCANRPGNQASLSISGIDYANYTDLCETFNEGADCTENMPMRFYGTESVATNCIPQQRNRCDRGFTRLGLFSNNVDCAAEVPAVTATATATPSPSPSPTPSTGGWILRMPAHLNSICHYENTTGICTVNMICRHSTSCPSEGATATCTFPVVLGDSQFSGFDNHSALPANRGCVVDTASTPTTMPEPRWQFGGGNSSGQLPPACSFNPDIYNTQNNPVCANWGESCTFHQSDGVSFQMTCYN